MSEPVEGSVRDGEPVEQSVRDGEPAAPAEREAERELDQSASGAAYRPVPGTAGDDGADGRFWSRRRVPAALLALLVAAGAGLLLFDIASVRAGRPGMRWRRSLAGELASRPLDDTWVLAGAAAAVLAGVWLVVLAVTPGLRNLLPMRRRAGDADVRAALDRDAAELVLRDRAVEVSGVQSVRVRVRRSRVAVRAVSHFRELDEVRSDLDTALGDGIRELGLVRRPALSVQVRRPAGKG
ncbi:MULTISPECIES: DUF6286 domain-containing protein [Streptomyces]|uniref:DUF6286 domain-containing protein n=1 Tax=Streptomyces tirandamycinicus TaxID=2174846 RepID=A0A2S1SQS0_9ACTN|nr:MULTISPECIES: DUF6286 domain-containing protein [Streptomyces]AWI28677.1 hypothetical protein DDW44_07655 [Streptomyces tirandamycinicus]MCY0983427.1 DUF6286 domain-containing protein [Streptomyces tirandamycinicus]NNJ06343.1 hypothetical protein [Streptomyces sp. PKU-MA01144]